MNKTPEQTQTVDGTQAICWADFGSRKPIAEIHRRSIRAHLTRFLATDPVCLSVQPNKTLTENRLHFLACQLTGMSAAPLKTH